MYSGPVCMCFYVFFFVSHFTVDDKGPQRAINRLPIPPTATLPILPVVNKDRSFIAMQVQHSYNSSTSG